MLAVVPDDGVQTSDLRRALQYAESLRQWLSLLDGGQDSSKENKENVLIYINLIGDKNFTYKFTHAY